MKKTTKEIKAVNPVAYSLIILALLIGYVKFTGKVFYPKLNSPHNQSFSGSK
ncbi:MAG: hypothetical protein KBD48_02410 [Candidatus Pacebacteria bacterium]|nr:hypothetical protein [Candidatus Paceibacterota bacterium]MBP9716016.1 hypothetical protein [Candidatus Paceibacterota bacterium]